MVSLTKKEREALLVLFKDFTAYYNANSLSKVLGISHVGCQKILKRLLKGNLVNAENIGKSIVYKPRLEDEYVCRLLAFLLADEANNSFKRWQEEFKSLFKKDRIIMLFGSVLKNAQTAKDIDIMIILSKEDSREVRKIIKEKQEILPKKIHLIELTEQDLKSNINKKQEVILGIIRNAVILYGQDKYVEVMQHVAGF
ncbi:MAG TPA: nucleotidyltransferase domain-containing protein [Candidatus Nanoarchaeia archaeon]|nr:nucleotidyltransferase domain-containing protein [Candidatus Nanoarchaeia archaeon]